MPLDLNVLTKDIAHIDTKDFCSDWLWLVDDQNHVILISSIGDMFFQAPDNSIYWLDIGMADLNYVADSIEEFQKMLTDEKTLENWFLPDLVNQLISSGKILGKNQVYSFIKPPILGGDYSIENFETTDISVHFSFYGQLHKQIWDAKDGTQIGDIILK